MFLILQILPWYHVTLKKRLYRQPVSKQETCNCHSAIEPDDVRDNKTHLRSGCGCFSRKFDKFENSLVVVIAAMRLSPKMLKGNSEEAYNYEIRFCKRDPLKYP